MQEDESEVDAAEPIDDDDGRDESSDDAILKLAHKRYDIAVEATTKIHQSALEDIQFSAGEQWPDNVKREREQDVRPCLTINRIPQFIRQITNDQKQNRPSIKVSPIDDKADVETARILQGMIRHIENSSDADTAYDMAFDSAVRGGFGYFRIITDYVSPLSFDQEIRFKMIRNRFSIQLDPSYKQPDGSDANWGFEVVDMTKDEFKAQFPNAKMSRMDDWDAIGNSVPGWATKDGCRVAEYFYKELKEFTLCLLSDKTIYRKDQLPPILPTGVTVVKERQSVEVKVKWCKINATEILEMTDWDSKWIPIIPVLGEMIDDGTELKLEGVVRYAKDPQRMYNYFASSETETIALAPRTPWVGVEWSFEGFEGQWKTANTRNHAFLQYKAKTIGGQPAPPPTRNTFEPPIQAISAARALSVEDLKGTTGIYDDALGKQSNADSGIAIKRRTTQSQTSNFHFVDNLTKSLRHAGRICIDLIPNVYDTARAQRILGDDGTEEVVWINALFEKDGKKVTYDLGAGEYDVTISTGPSYETKRQEAVASIIDLTKSYPQMAQIAGDILVRNMDWQGSAEIADRLKKMLPPGVADDDKAQHQQLPAQVTAQMQQQNQMIQQLSQELQAATMEIKTKKFELESKERIAFAQLQMDASITMAKLGSKSGEFLMDHEVGQIDRRLSMIGMDQPIDAPQPQNQNPAPGPNQSAAPGQAQQPPTGGLPPGKPMGAQ